MTQTLDKYQLHELLGSGATADVYRATDQTLGREVALKLLKPALVADASAFARFAQEAQAAAKLFHNHIATVLDMGEAEGRYYIAMRYVDGSSLGEIIQSQGPLSWDETLRIAQQIGEALEFAQRQGFLHRDVKPSNILRDQNGDYWLTDFGLTRAMMSTGLTSHTGAVLGTPAYIAPEIWDGQEASAASDQYSLACVIAEALSGQVLFSGSTPMAVLGSHAKGANLPERWGEDVPDGFNTVLLQALEKDPAARFRNIIEFTVALAQMEATAQARRETEVETYLPQVAASPPSTNQPVETSQEPILEQPIPTLKDNRKKSNQKWVWAVIGILVLLVSAYGLKLISDSFGDESDSIRSTQNVKKAQESTLTSVAVLYATATAEAKETDIAQDLAEVPTMAITPTDLPSSTVLPTPTTTILLQDQPISIDAFTNVNIKNILPNLPFGEQYFGEVEFFIPENPNNSIHTQSSKDTGRPTEVTIPLPLIAQPESIYILINAGYTSGYENKLAGTIDVFFSDGRTLTYNLILGKNLREWNIGTDLLDAVILASSPDSIEVYREKNSAVLDMLRLPIPTEYQTGVLDSITFRDTSQDSTGTVNPALIIVGITIRAQYEP